MASSIVSMLCSVFVLLLLRALISPGFNQIIGTNSMAMAIEDEEDSSMDALLPFGSAAAIGGFSGFPQCGGPRPIGRLITVQNNCERTIWPGIFTSSPEHQLSTTGFELAVGASRSLNIPESWAGRVWARTQCSNKDRHLTCLTGDCRRGLKCNGVAGVPPATLVEFSLSVSTIGEDFYDVSLVDGFNIPASITTQGGLGPCKSSNCLTDVNSVCPAELQVKSGDQVIACKSACTTFHEPRYCCTGEFSSPDKCGQTNYSLIFKNQCPDAYSYAFDDNSSTFTCHNGPDYVVTFCG